MKYYIVIGNDGEVYGIYSPLALAVDTMLDNESNRCTIHYAHTQEGLWPDALKDGAICIIVNEISIWESWPDWPE